MLRQPVLRQLPRPLRVMARVQRRTLLSRRGRTSGRAVETLNIRKMVQETEDYQRNRRIFLACGALAGIISFICTAWKLKQALDKPAQMDSSLAPSDPLMATSSASRKVVTRDEQGRELVPTGHSVVPSFPRTMDVATDSPTATEYTLVGMGMRTVTFFGIEVYIVGFYVATADIAAFQSALIKKVNPIATTLVPDERDRLRTALLDDAQSRELWGDLLDSHIPARSAFRVVPVKDTDFGHLRDGFVRAIQHRAGSSAGDETFGEGVRQFRSLFPRMRAPKQKELLLLRDGGGRLTMVYDDGKTKTTESQSGGRQVLGVVEDERVSHALWMNYLAGKNVASERARQNIVQSVMELVERPVGTVATQVI